MKFRILHEIKGRMRIHIAQKTMTDREADTLRYYLENCEMILDAKVYERTQDAVIRFSGERERVIGVLRAWSTSPPSPENPFQWKRRREDMYTPGQCSRRES